MYKKIPHRCVFWLSFFMLGVRKDRYASATGAANPYLSHTSMASGRWSLTPPWYVGPRKVRRGMSPP